MNHWLSRRHPRYIRSLVYMLQASEYDIRDFFRWHERVKDFRSVEKRKQLVFTPKATFLFALGWVIVLLAFGGAVLIFLNVGSPWNYLLSIFIVLEMPLIAMSSVLLALLGIQTIQYPVESIILAHTRERLASHRGIKIAIAGSYGKTSTREILKTVLSESKKVAAPPESYNTPLGMAKFVRGLEDDEDVLIFELGEYYPGDVRRLARVINPEWGIITGINEAHLEKFKTLDRTGDTIFELAEFVEPGNLYLNGENGRVRARARRDNVVYTREGAGTWNVIRSATNLSGTTFTITDGMNTLDATSGLLGLHMLAPLSVAADIASRLGLSKKHIERGLEKTKPFAHRLEPKIWADGVTFLDDSYNGNPDGVRAAIAFLASLSNRRLYVTPGLVEAGERVKEVHEEIGSELAHAGIEKVALIRNSVTPHIKAGLTYGGFKGELLWYDDMPACIAALRALALPGDVILIQNDWPDQYA